jgi:hypothetical protein
MHLPECDKLLNVHLMNAEKRSAEFPSFLRIQNLNITLDPHLKTFIEKSG